MDRLLGEIVVGEGTRGPGGIAVRAPGSSARGPAQHLAWRGKRGAMGRSTVLRGRATKRGGQEACCERGGRQGSSGKVQCNSTGAKVEKTVRGNARGAKRWARKQDDERWAKRPLKVGPSPNTRTQGGGQAQGTQVWKIVHKYGAAQRACRSAGRGRVVVLWFSSRGGYGCLRQIRSGVAVR